MFIEFEAPLILGPDDIVMGGIIGIHCNHLIFFISLKQSIGPNTILNGRRKSFKKIDFDQW